MGKGSHHETDVDDKPRDALRLTQARKARVAADRAQGNSAGRLNAFDGHTQRAVRAHALSSTVCWSSKPDWASDVSSRASSRLHMPPEHRIQSRAPLPERASVNRSTLAPSPCWGFWPPDARAVCPGATVAADEPGPRPGRRCKRCRLSSMIQAPSIRLAEPPDGFEEIVKTEWGQVETMTPAIERQRIEPIQEP